MYMYGDYRIAAIPCSNLPAAEIIQITSIVENPRSLMHPYYVYSIIICSLKWYPRPEASLKYSDTTTHYDNLC